MVNEESFPNWEATQKLRISSTIFGGLITGESIISSKNNDLKASNENSFILTEHAYYKNDQSFDPFNKLMSLDKYQLSERDLLTPQTTKVEEKDEKINLEPKKE